MVNDMVIIGFIWCFLSNEIFLRLISFRRLINENKL